MQSQRSRESISMALAFALVLAVFAMETLKNFSIKGGTPVGFEKRPAAALPVFKLSRNYLRKYPAGFETFFNDRFAWRTDLVFAIALARFRCFGLTDKDRVLVGKDDWLYYRDGGDDETLRRWPMSPTELAAWTKMLVQRKAWCQRRGIKFFYAIAPTKSTIYREFVPKQYNTIYPYSQADQLIAYLRKHTDLDVIDLRPALQAQKRRGQMFFKTDTHWNKLGAYLGYRVIADALSLQFPAIHPLGMKDLEIVRGNTRSGDLLDLVGLPGVIVEKYDDYVPRGGQTWRVSRDPPPAENIYEETTRFVPFATENDKSSPVKAFFIRDSYMIWAQPYFSQTFRRSFYFWDGFYGFPTAYIAREKPDFVVMEMVERFLARPVPINPPDIMQ